MSSKSGKRDGGARGIEGGKIKGLKGAEGKVKGSNKEGREEVM